MYAKAFLFLAVVAAAKATGFYSSGILSHGLYNSGVVAPGLLNTVVAPGLYKGSALLSAPVAAQGLYKGSPLLSAAVPTTYSTGHVLSAPALVSTKSVVSPVAYSAPAAITTQKTVIGATSLLTGAPLVYSNGIYSNGIYSNGIYGNGLYGNGLYGSGLIGNRLIGAAPATYALNTGIVSPIGLKGAGFLAGPGVVRTILK